MLRDANKKRFAKRLGDAMEHADVTQQQVADALGVAVSTVSRWVRGLSTPGNDAFLLLAEFLRKPTDYFTNDEPPHRPASRKPASETHLNNHGQDLKKILREHDQLSEEVPRLRDENAELKKQLDTLKCENEVLVGQNKRYEAFSNAALSMINSYQRHQDKNFELPNCDAGVEQHLDLLSDHCIPEAEVDETRKEQDPED